MSGGPVPPDQRSQHRAGGTLIDIQEAIDRVLALSAADACIVIGRRQATANVRWANNTVTTNGEADEVSLSVVSIAGRRVGSVTRTYFPPEQLEGIVRESEAACARSPEAADFMPLLDGRGEPEDWHAPAGSTTIGVFEPFVPKLGAMFTRARGAGVQTFGYAEHTASTVWLALSTGLRRRYGDVIGKMDVTGKTPDFSRSSWAGSATQDFGDVEPGVLFDKLRERLAWAERSVAVPAGHYEVLLEPSCTADLALGAYGFMTRRDADEGRSPFSRPGGGTQLGERLFGDVTMSSDPGATGMRVPPFHVGVGSNDAVSVFDNGLPASRTEWVRDGRLQALFTPRFWAAKAGTSAVPYIDNLVVAGDGPPLEQMIASTERALLVTCLWYVRTVDPQTALQTGLTRDGVFLVERGRVTAAVNNFRWNMSPIVGLAQAVEIGRSGRVLPREHDEFLRVKAPPVRVERFNMSSVSEAS